MTITVAINGVEHPPADIALPERPQRQRRVVVVVLHQQDIHCLLLNHLAP